VHPATSFCAKGPNTDILLRNHPIEDGLGVDSPLGVLYKLEASILLIGVGHESNTSLHLAECLSGTRPRKKEGAAMILDGKREWVWYSDIDYDSSGFPEIGRQFEQSLPECVRRAKVGSADSRLLPVKQLVDFAADWLRARC
jgi:aminoglycoside 3-N-acetyltransferase